jgi:hypothetical protein
MSQNLVLKNVPADKVDAAIADLKKWGATDVQKSKQPDGAFTLTATFPD